MKRLVYSLLSVSILQFAVLIADSSAQTSNTSQRGRLFAPVADGDTNSGQGRVRINFGLLRADKLILDLDSNTSIDAVRDKDYDFGAGKRAWTGHVNGNPESSVILGQSGDVLAGVIRHDGRLYKLSYVGGGVHEIREFPTAQPQAHTPPVLAGGTGDSDGGDTAAQQAAEADAGGNTIFDVMVVYTANARASLNGTAAMEALIVTAVAETNQAYANSAMAVSLRLVHTAELIGDETGNASTDLGRLRSATDGYWDEVHGLRDLYGADMVSMIENMSGYCGIGYLMTSLSSSFAPYAFTAVHRTCATGYYSFGHELGHNQGSHHDHDNAGGALFPYSYGYQDPGAVFRTVMAYNCPGGCTRRQHFSNPDVTYAGYPTGVADWADNARSIEEAAATIAGWRAAVPLEAPLAPSALAATAMSHASIDLNWSDGSANETGFRIERSLDGTAFAEAGTVGANITSFTDSGLVPETLYYYKVVAVNGVGDSLPSNSDSATTLVVPPYTDQVAQGETFVHGSVSGSYTDTDAADGVVQTVTESHSGGKPQNRYAWLEHRWSFNVVPGSSVTLHLSVQTEVLETDSFEFAYSSDGNSWVPVVIVDGNSAGDIMVPLPANLSGAVQIRVADTVQETGNVTGHTIAIDRVMIRSEDATGTAPAAPSGLVAIGVSSSGTNLAWADNSTDETGFQVERGIDGVNFVVVATRPADSQSYQDSGLAPERKYFYRVNALNGAGSSDFTGTASATTLAGSDISLAANGYKLKGQHTVNLTWSGAGGTIVDIYRGGLLINTANDGLYTDAIGAKGGASYVYQLCEAGSPTACSDPLTVVF